MIEGSGTVIFFIRYYCIKNKKSRERDFLELKTLVMRSSVSRGIYGVHMFARIEITRNNRLNPAHPALQRETARSCLQILISESVYKVALRECTRWVHAKCERACRSPPHHKHLKLLSQGAGEDISLPPAPPHPAVFQKGVL